MISTENCSLNNLSMFVKAEEKILICISLNFIFPSLNTDMVWEKWLNKLLICSFWEAQIQPRNRGIFSKDVVGPEKGRV